MGCGKGRWAKHISSKVGLLNSFNPSDAINIAKKNLGEFENVYLIRGDVNNAPKIEIIKILWTLYPDFIKLPEIKFPIERWIR